MFEKIKRFLIGKPLTNDALSKEKYTVFWGLPILASDAISSVAYAIDEILLVLVPALGMAVFSKNILIYIAAAIIILLALITISYRQTIDNYPNGGGAYIVAKENLGLLAGITAGAALSVGYVMTVAVSVSSGIAQITSTFEFLEPYKVLICLIVIFFLMIGNLRGISESAKIFSIPTYAFIIAVVSLLIGGFVKLKSGYVPVKSPSIAHIQTSPISIYLILKAFSSGCAALTGVEAVSNAVPSFKEPSTKHAKRVLLLLSTIILFIFGGISIIVSKFTADPMGDKTVIIQISEQIFNHGFMFYFIMATTFTILVMAANTAYSGFPILISVMAKEGYAPRQLSTRGDRLSYSNGIIVLSLVAALLIVIFDADVTSLIGLYAIGVFISFTLSQFGMFRKWQREKGDHWKKKAFVNGLGALVTAITVLVIAVAKFREGAWIVVFLLPIMILSMLKVKKHYTAVAEQLRLEPEEIEKIDIAKDNYRNRVIIPIQSINKSSIRALRYARTISNNVIAFNISTDEEMGKKVQEKYNMLKTDIPLVIKYSPYRKVVEPLLEFIRSEEYDYKKGDMITVVLPKFTVSKWWHNILHNHTWLFIEKELLKHKHIVVATMPLQLKDDNIIEHTMKLE